MIYTVTLNPSLDYIVTVDYFKLGFTNRTVTEQIVPGGKGINVSIVLKRLGYASVAWGFQAGFVGEEIARRLLEDGIDTDFVPVEQEVNRINVKLASVEGTEINGMGPKIGEKHLSAFRHKLDVLKDGDLLVLSGSVPPSVPQDIYLDIMQCLENREVKVVVDAAGKLLWNVLEYRPFLVKPNRQELSGLFGVDVAELAGRDAVIPYGRKLQEMGAANVLVSLGGEGAVLLAEDGAVRALAAPKGKAVNTVGAGDSMVAGFLAGWMEKQDYAYAFRKAVAAGSASAFSEGFCTREAVEDLELSVTYAI